MKSLHALRLRSGQALVCLAVVFVSVHPLAGQVRGLRSGGPAAIVSIAPVTIDPMTGPLVTGAPFSADAATIVSKTLGDGTRIEQRITARLFRDTSGRVRREQTVLGLDALTPGTPARTVITFDSVASDPMPYVIDPVARTARRMPRGAFVNDWNGGVTFFGGLDARRVTRQSLGDLVDRLRPANPADADVRRELERATNLYALQLNLGGGRQIQPFSPETIPADVTPTEEQLGTRQFEGVKATGRRITAVIPIDRVGNDRPITITDERWESPELRLVVYSRFSDPRTGVVEFRLTGINRSEPRPDLFTVPAEYTVIGGGGVVGTPGGVVGPPGLRGGGGGGARGQRGGAPQQ